MLKEKIEEFWILIFKGPRPQKPLKTAISNANNKKVKHLFLLTYLIVG